MSEEGDQREAASLYRWSGNKAMVNRGSTGEVVLAFSHQAAARGQEDNCMNDAWLFAYHLRRWRLGAVYWASPIFGLSNFNFIVYKCEIWAIIIACIVNRLDLIITNETYPSFYAIIQLKLNYIRG